MATNAVQLKIASFWRKDPELWFFQLEKLFVIHNITTDNTKFNHVVSVLDTDVLSAVRRIVLSPPEKDKYDALKKGIIAAFADSKSTRLSQLLSGQEIGDQKPSQVLNNMIQTATGVMEDQSAIRQLWTQRLHPTVRAVIAAHPPNHSLMDLARQADLVTEAIQVPIVNAISAQKQPETDKFEELSRQFEALATEVRHMRSEKKPPRRSSPQRDSGLCWFHEKFGNQARRCRPPCTFKPKN